MDIELTLCKIDLAVLVAAQYKSPNLSLKLPVNVTVIIKTEGSDKGDQRITPLIRDSMNNAVHETLEKWADNIIRSLMLCDKAIEREPMRRDHHLKDCEGVITSYRAHAEKAAHDAAMKAWKAMIQKYERYRLYKFSVVSKITCSLSAIAVSVGLIASDWSGATAAISFTALVKSCQGLIGQLKDLNKQAENVEKEILDSINELVERYNSSGGFSRNVGEVGSAILNTVLPSPKVETLVELESKCDLWMNKLSGIEVRANEASKSLDKILTLIPKVEKSLKIYFKDLNKNPSSNPKDPRFQTIKDLFIHLKRLQDWTAALLDFISAQYKRVEKGKAKAVEYRGRIEELKERISETARTFSKIAVLSGLVYAGTGEGVDALVNAGVIVMENAGYVANLAKSLQKP